MKTDAERSKPYWERANQVKKLATDLDNYIISIREEMYKRGGGAAPNGDVASRDNIDISPALMINQGKAKELKKKIEHCWAPTLDSDDRTSNCGNFLYFLPASIILSLFIF